MSKVRTEERSILQTATQAGNFSMLLKAVHDAGLADTLNGPGPFTFFAPNDAAFKRMDDEELAAIMKDKRRLADILKYHVLPGRHSLIELMKLNNVQMLNDGYAPIRKSGRDILIGDAKIIQPDIQAENGVIHVIDHVMMP